MHSCACPVVYSTAVVCTLDGVRKNQPLSQQAENGYMRAPANAKPSVTYEPKACAAGAGCLSVSFTKTTCVPSMSNNVPPCATTRLNSHDDGEWYRPGRPGSLGRDDDGDGKSFVALQSLFLRITFEALVVPR